MRHYIFSLLAFVSFSAVLLAVTPSEFLSPPDTARPWVYWFIMDGNLTREGITADFEAMKEQGIGGVILMEVNVGVPRGNVDFMSEEWQRLFAHIVHETERLGLQLTLNSGPGWTGSGGPWITPEKSMWHLAASEKNVRGPMAFNEALPLPQPRTPFFGEGLLPEKLEKARKEFFKDVRVLAFPKPKGATRTADIDEKALYVRAPYSSAPGVKPRIPAPAVFDAVPAEDLVGQSQIVDLTDRLDASGILQWDVPDGEWTILRLAATTTGANTRPAPAPGVGLECSKMDRDAFNLHADNFISKLFEVVGKRQTDGKAGWCFFHIDSWEMGSQNYSDSFLAEFKKRRGYDPVPFLPCYIGFIVDSPEKTERFLWDVRLTSQELIVENHGIHLREVAHKNGLKLSIEPYDMIPCCNMTFGAVADVPMCEFWTGPFDTVFSCFEAASLAHTHGKPVVAAEAFTNCVRDSWRHNPKTMKQLGDWAFCTGINRFVFHRYQHQPYLDRYPGFSMGDIGIHWERTQTWWPLIHGYHRYLARCQHVLRQGVAVVDVLYLLPEGAPQVFTPPDSALITSGTIMSGITRDQRGYRFDACDPATFLDLATVKNGSIAFPNGTTYRILVLPHVETMTLSMLEKIESLVRQGATIVGNAPKQSPSLQNYPQVDRDIQTLATKMWGGAGNTQTVVPFGKGSIVPMSVAAVSEQPMVFDGAKWIWYPEGNPVLDAPAGSRYFRKTIHISNVQSIDTARMIGTADNDLTVKVNGEEIYRSNLGNPAPMKRFENTLKNGDNLIEIEAINGESDQRNPAGLLAKFEIIAGESVVRFSTDGQWDASQDGKAWTSAMVLGDFGMEPWSIQVAKEADPLYPDYNVTAKILADKGIGVDCDGAEKGLRFFHRQAGQTDYYFVGNRMDQPFHGEISFRVTGKRVSIWDPLTGQIFRAPQTKTTSKTTSVVLDLEGSQSIFVVFDTKGVPARSLVWQSYSQELVADLANDWEVHFDSKRSGPQSPVPFPKLLDWSVSNVEEIKYYSGMATYKKTFTVSDIARSGKRLWLDLGDVEVMAAVKLNNKDLGIRWIAPYKFDVTDDLRKGENTLEITVANLWPNRLIGDAKLPAEKRMTWTTFTDAYGADVPLYPSGLVGPVRILKDK